MSTQNVVFRSPTLLDATSVFDLVDACKPLDLNSHYLYLLQCSHFSDTCVVAEVNGEIAGWVSGYLLPESNSTFFVWQVAVGVNARGLGLGARMIQWLVQKFPETEQIHTSITPDNQASWGLFKSLARKWGSDLSSRDWFESQAHFAGRHDTEMLVEIPVPASVEIATAS